MTLGGGEPFAFPDDPPRGLPRTAPAAEPAARGAPETPIAVAIAARTAWIRALLRALAMHNLPARRGSVHTWPTRHCSPDASGSTAAATRSRTPT